MTITALLALGWCGRPAETRESAADTMIRRYVGLARALGERDPDSLDFSVAEGAGPGRAGVGSEPTDLGSLRAQATSLRADLMHVRESRSFPASRKRFLLGQVDALTFRIQQLSGETRPFDEESRALFGVAAPADRDAAERREIRRQIAKLLGSARTPAAAYSRYQARFVVPPDRVAAVMDAALKRCRALTLEHVSLPAEEHVRVDYVSNKPWSAFSRYLGNSQSLIEVNVDYPLTVDRILELASHEGYPGHHVFNLLRDQALVRGLHRDEFRVQPTFSPQSYVSEAAANYAPALLLPEKQRAEIERDLLAIAGLAAVDVARYVEVERLVAGLHSAEPAIARDYLDGRLEFERAAEALERETLMEHPETMLLYLNEFRSYMLTYTIGADQVKGYIERGNPDSAERWARYLKPARDQEMAWAEGFARGVGPGSDSGAQH